MRITKHPNLVNACYAPVTEALMLMLSCVPACSGGRVSDAWAPAATHVVCAVNENREARRTLKYMQVRPCKS